MRLSNGSSTIRFYRFFPFGDKEFYWAGLDYHSGKSAWVHFQINKYSIMIGAKADPAATYEGFMKLTDGSSGAVDFLYVMADEIGMLEQAMLLYHLLHRDSEFGKCIILRTDAINNSHSK